MKQACKNETAPNHPGTETDLHPRCSNNGSEPDRIMSNWGWERNMDSGNNKAESDLPCTDLRSKHMQTLRFRALAVQEVR